MSNKEVFFNRPQMLLHTVNANKSYCLWGRGTGKTNGGIGPRILQLFEKMPGAQIGLPVPSYVMAQKQIIPNIAGFWENEMGLKEGENYVIGKKPHEDWAKPKLPIADFKNVISFDNGCVMPIVSLEVQGAGNGLNMQAIIGDEAKFFDEKKLKEIIRAVRGGYSFFGHLPEFQSQWYFTDKYDGDVEWMLAKRKLMNWDKIKAVVALQLRLNDLIQQGKNVTMQNRIQALLTQTRKDLVFVSEASAEENRDILGDKFFADQKENSTAIEYQVAIKNEDPTQTEHPYYQQLQEHHYYASANDISLNAPLIIALDYQWRITPIVVAQYSVLPGNKDISLNFIDSLHTLSPEGIIDAIDKFADKYSAHKAQLIYYVYDKTAVGRNPMGKSFCDTVIERLRYHSFKVVPINSGETPKHDDKFKMINRLLTGQSGKLPIRINNIRNEHLLNSIRLTGAITYMGKTSKDKSSEKNLSIPAEKSTHYSDVFDMIIYAALELMLIRYRQ